MNKLIAVYPMAAAGCGACMETLLSTAVSGFTLTDNPRRADVIAVTGFRTKDMDKELEKLRSLCPRPVKVLYFGSCAASGAVFAATRVSRRMASEKNSVPGCPPAADALEKIGADI